MFEDTSFCGLQTREHEIGFQYLEHTIKKIPLADMGIPRILYEEEAFGENFFI